MQGLPVVFFVHDSRCKSEAATCFGYIDEYLLSK